MPNLKQLLITLPMLLLLSATPVAHSTLLEEEKRVEIDALLEIFQTRKLSELIAQNFTQSMVYALSQKYGKLDSAVSDIIFNEAKVIMYEEFILNGKLNDIFYNLYDEYYTAAQLRELVRFYNSSTGRRLIEVGDKIQRRSMEDATKHAATFGLKAQERIQKRLQETSEALQKAQEAAKKAAAKPTEEAP